MEFIIKDNTNDIIFSSAKTIDELSDGYHTFKELYDFRREYNAALVNTGIWKAHKSYSGKVLKLFVLKASFRKTTKYFSTFRSIIYAVIRNFH